MKEITWFTIEEQTPPDRELYVKFHNDTIRKAIPTYYPFEFINGKVVPKENEWDGKWMIEAINFNDDVSDLTITHWAELNEEDNRVYKLPQ